VRFLPEGALASSSPERSFWQSRSMLVVGDRLGGSARVPVDPAAQSLRGPQRSVAGRSGTELLGMRCSYGTADGRRWWFPPSGDRLRFPHDFILCSHLIVICDHLSTAGGPVSQVVLAVRFACDGDLRRVPLRVSSSRTGLTYRVLSRGSIAAPMLTVLGTEYLASSASSAVAAFWDRALPGTRFAWWRCRRERPQLRASGLGPNTPLLPTAYGRGRTPER